ncbi:5'-methylthioadenosine/S-adenosylhomocysteine nucleosidase family protein [Aspergillus udagawae]|uniref:Nucleoside phosphorylase domain-containing protein n=1 Tax=Aspergillus udagawae TaxID=91492 RepID=A0A8E0QNE3_9EURO|nr:uncharacterized protein Aud_003646 [Aspergillus udagawae]GIC87262.1 hypothetical protein Aud_003646 [Aspergillus udagawae]
MDYFEPDDYTIAWICALPLEAAAARAMLDGTDTPPQSSAIDPNAYEFGSLAGHSIIIANLPDDIYGEGEVSAAAFVSRMRSTFPRLRFGLSVGIGGGVPGGINDIRLGDVVVGTPGASHSGVIQYDYGKAVEPTRTLNSLPQALLTLITSIQARQIVEADGAVSRIVWKVLEQNNNLKDIFSPPKEHTDFLFHSSYRHVDNEDTCEKCDKEQLVERPLRDTRTPYIHYGAIASGNQVMKNSEMRDHLAQQNGILCFEMEAAGLMDEFPTLVIRGICDYCDSHKNGKWRGYAALTAAAYAKLLLSAMPVYRKYPIMRRGAQDYSSLREDIRSMDKDFPRKDNMWDTSMAKYSHGSPKGTDPTREVPTEAYPPSMAEITATESSVLSRGFESWGDALETVNASTAGTSVDPGGQEMDGDSADDESIYTSDVPRSLAYVQELVSSFFRGAELPDAESLERIRDGLPDLLRGFAQRIGGENHSSGHFEVMKFIYKRRVDIATSFGQQFLDDIETLQQRKLNDMSLDERLSMWRFDQEMDDPSSAAARPDDVPLMDDDAQLDGDDNNDDNENTLDNSQLEMYRNVVTNSTAFQWLLCRLHREASLTTSEASSWKAISTQIRQALYSRRESRLVSSRKAPPKCSAVFQSDWDPLAFIRDQKYKEEPEDAVERAIVIVQGPNGDVEAMPCSEYVGRTWPLFGEHFMGLVKHTVRSIPSLRCSVTLFDNTRVTSWVEPSGCFSLEAVGVAETIVEVGEVFAFVTVALRSAKGDLVASVSPTIDNGTKTSDQTCRLTIRPQYSDGPLRSTGQCWQDLFRNPVVVLGFPVRRRRPDQEPGLEISLATLAALLGTRRIVVFCGKVFLQGFCTMVVPTKYDGDTVHWHVLFNENGSRISLTDFRVRKIVQDFDLLKHLTLSGVESARHIVGWCEHVRNYAGLPQPGSRFAFDRVSISAGKIVSVGASVAISKKDKPARAAKKTDYHKQIEWAEERFIVLYDCKDRRAWLIDGLSALLHLVRAHLAHRRKVGREVLFSERDIKEPNTPYMGKTAANAVLRNRANMDLKIYERWNRVVEETSRKGEEPPETSHKTQKTWEQLPDLVGEIYTTLGMLFDIQTDILTADGFGAKVHISPRRHLEGWDFQQVAAGTDPLLPKAALLRDTGLGWVDLVRAINAITLFGVGFGEILQPVDAAVDCALGGGGDGDTAGSGPAVNPPQGGTRCDRWAALPMGEDLLATTTPVIRDIMEGIYKDHDSKQRLWELFTGIYWHCPDKVFEDCHCRATPGGTQCDRVQVLLPTKFPTLFARGFRSPPEPLPAHGAVIFGHSVKFPLIWKWEACSVPTEGHLQPPQLTSRSSRQSDSGLGSSAASSSVHDESLSRGSSLRPASSESTHGAVSSLSLAPVNEPRGTTTSGKNAKNIVKRLFKKRSK